MSSRTQSHQLSGGLYVSGKRDPLPKHSTLSSSSSSRAPVVPYTGGDIKKSGELGKMMILNTSSTSTLSSSQPATPKIPSRPGSQPNSGSARSGSGPLPRLSTSGSMPKTKSSGPMTLQPTGLITSGPLTSSGAPSGSLENPVHGNTSGPGGGGGGGGGGKKVVYGAGVTSMGGERVKYGVKVGRGVMWVFGIVVLMGLLVGGFLAVAVKKAVILVAVVGVLSLVLAWVGWNYAWGWRAVLGFVKTFPDTELRGAVDGQFVKVSGVVTCGSIALESSFQKMPRCVYVSTELYEYRGWGGKVANTRHRCFSWGCRHSEKYVADFYISDFHSGLRALVKMGYGAKVAPLVETTTVADITKEKKDLSPNFLRWLADRSLSSDDRVMRVKEGYVKEGSTVSVMGVVRRHENILMIVPPNEPISTGCQWLRCLLPMYVEGLILHCEDNEDSEVIPV